MTRKLPPEIEEMLKKAGIDPGKWGESPEHFTDMGVVTRQRGNLLKLKEVLERTLADDQKRLADLREQATRLKHGGGS